MSDVAEFRDLPSVYRVVAALDSGEGPTATEAARRAVDLARDRIRNGGGVPTFEEIVASARDVLYEQRTGHLRRVINGTGVLVHTNLGRAPLGAAQIDAVRDVASSYSNLEFDLETGRRGRREDHTRNLLKTLTGAEDAIVVNNNAAAVLVVLSALCARREVIVSRGELIEIGGEFRIPDVIASSGASLVEVGTTNRTRLEDYERAIGPETAALLKVHPSNYRIVGFTAEVAATDLAKLARGRGLPLIHDLGSGLAQAPQEWLKGEPQIRASVEEGTDIVTFSGDKLLGGPQAGIIVGRGELIEQIARHPLIRALRVDKMTLAALEATLSAHVDGRTNELPLWIMATQELTKLQTRAQEIVRRLAHQTGNAHLEVITTSSVTGGGSLPGVDLPSIAIAITHPEHQATEINDALRAARPPVIARIEDGRVLIDLRTVLPTSDAELTQILGTVLG